MRRGVFGSRSHETSVEWTVYFKNVGTSSTPIAARRVSPDPAETADRRSPSPADTPILENGRLWRGKPENTRAMRKAYTGCRRIAPLMLEGDYYPLTPYTFALDRWIAWQFNRPKQGDGVVQAFRRGQSNYEAARFKLRGLDPGAEYVLMNLDSGQSQTLAGRELLDKGLAVPIADQPGSAVIVYKRKK